MEIVVSSLLLTSLTLLDLQCAEGSGSETPRERGLRFSHTLNFFPPLRSRSPSLENPTGTRAESSHTNQLGVPGNGTSRRIRQRPPTEYNFFPLHTTHPAQPPIDPPQPLTQSLRLSTYQMENEGGADTSFRSSNPLRARGQHAVNPDSVPEIDIREDASCTLLLSDHSTYIGALERYEPLELPRWIRVPVEGEYIIYVQTPNGDSWITKLRQSNPPVLRRAPEPVKITMKLHNNIRLFARVTLLNRNVRRLFHSTDLNKYYIFLNMKNGVSYRGYLKLERP